MKKVVIMDIEELKQEANELSKTDLLELGEFCYELAETLND